MGPPFNRGVNPISKNIRQKTLLQIQHDFYDNSDDDNAVCIVMHYVTSWHRRADCARRQHTGVLLTDGSCLFDWKTLSFNLSSYSHVSVSQLVWFCWQHLPMAFFHVFTLTTHLIHTPYRCPSLVNVALGHLFIPPHFLSAHPINLPVCLFPICLYPRCHCFLRFFYLRFTSKTGTRLILMWTRLQ